MKWDEEQLFNEAQERYKAKLIKHQGVEAKLLVVFSWVKRNNMTTQHHAAICKWIFSTEK